jgi:hypothetical protein
MTQRERPDKTTALVDEIDALVDWQLSQKPEKPDDGWRISVFAGDFTGDTRRVHITMDEGHGVTWVPMTPDRARRLAERLTRAASEADDGDGAMT